ncbi:hypothetical protein HYW55_00290 [Candidatus Gottesmanbacteria bacterium]|nr:hypothetical protein [Candidatus Gottesmanbacteria bacterium]
MNRGAAEYKKILVVFVVLVVLLIGTLVLRMQKQNELNLRLTNGNGSSSQGIVPSIPPRGTYKIVLDKSETYVGETVTATIIFDAPGFTLSGTDAIIQFDESILNAESPITTSDFFITYPRKIIDNEKGIIKITGFQTKETVAVTTPVTLASIQFRSIKAGNTEISFDFVVNSTSHTTLVEKGTAKNIVDAIENAKVSIQ